MGKKKTKYDSMLEEMRDKVQKAGGSRYSKSDRTAVTHGLLNQPDQALRRNHGHINNCKPGNQRFV